MLKKKKKKKKETRKVSVYTLKKVNPNNLGIDITINTAGMSKSYPLTSTSARYCRIVGIATSTKSLQKY